MPVSSVAIACGKRNKQIFLLRSLNQNYAYVMFMIKKMLKEAARKCMDRKRGTEVLKSSMPQRTRTPLLSQR